jgi:hypothetical protein
MAQQQSRHRPPSGFSAPLADPAACGDRRGTMADGRAQSVVAGATAVGAPRPAAAATVHPYAPAAPDAARYRGHHREPGVAGASAGQSPGDPQTPRRAASGGDGPALGGSLCAAARADPARRAASTWAPVREHFPLIAIADGSTLEALRKKTQELRERAGSALSRGCGRRRRIAPCRC